MLIFNNRPQYFGDADLKLGASLPYTCSVRLWAKTKNSDTDENKAQNKSLHYTAQT
jgi:hypothetical protein